MNRKVALVTGASSGIGADAAQRLAASGFHVFAAARRLDRLEAVCSIEAECMEPLQMDVTDSSAVRAGVEHIMETEGRIDVLVNNAGYGFYGSIEGAADKNVRRVFEVNVFGAGEVLRAVVPIMRQQGSGRIINMSSVVGRTSSVLLGWYAATKHAVEAMSDALRQEVAGFGIHVSMIEPGAIATEFEEVALDSYMNDPKEPDAYTPAVATFAKALKDQYRGSPGPEVVSKAVLHAATSSRPKRRYVVTGTAKVIVLVVRVLGYGAYDRIIKSVMMPK